MGKVSSPGFLLVTPQILTLPQMHTDLRGSLEPKSKITGAEIWITIRSWGWEQHSCFPCASNLNIAFVSTPRAVPEQAPFLDVMWSSFGRRVKVALQPTWTG